MVYIDYKITILHKEFKKKNLFEGTTPEPLLGGGIQRIVTTTLGPPSDNSWGGVPPNNPPSRTGIQMCLKQDL
jgi:hypothetical protein